MFYYIIIMSEIIICTQNKATSPITMTMTIIEIIKITTAALFD